ncbi:MAG TPA: hypothetical protein VF175_19200 [Lacipirellula sp.]
MGEIPKDMTRELVERVLQQGEIRLSAQLQIALAADQRAVTAAAILVAVASVTLGFAGDEITKAATDIPFAVSTALAGLMLLISAAVCVTAAMPTKFALAGAVPENWWSDGVTERAYEECLWRESCNYTRRIVDNRETLRQNADRLRLGMYLACSAPVTGLASFGVVRLCL